MLPETIDHIGATEAVAKHAEALAAKVKEALQWIDSMNAGTGCPAATECANSNLAPTPPGSVPGIW